MSSDHEVHFSLDFLFALASLEENDMEKVTEDVRRLANKEVEVETRIATLDEDTPEKNYDSLDELLDTDLSDEETADNVVDKVVEENIKPNVREIKQARIELQNLNIEALFRNSRRKKKIKESPSGSLLALEFHVDENDQIRVTDNEDSSGDEEEALVKCHQCNKRMSRSSLKSHIKSTHKKPSSVKKQLIECDLCDEKMSQDSLNNHLKTAHNIHNVGFEAISQQLKNIEHVSPMKMITLKEEESGDEEEEPSQISDDFFRILDPNYQEKPKEEAVPRPSLPMKPPETAKCNSCQKNIPVDKMADHEQTYHIANDYKCCLCYQLFRSKDILRSHIKTIHKKEMDLLDKRWEPDFSYNDCRVKCEDCEEMFMTANSCNYHKRVVHAMCNHCNISFSDSQTLKLHMKKRHDEE